MESEKQLTTMTPTDFTAPPNTKLPRGYEHEEQILPFLIANLRKQLANETIRVRHDDEYLARFLRVKKYNVAKARETLVHYQKVIEKNQDILKPIRPRELQSIYDDHLVIMLRDRGEKGERIIFIRAGHWDPSKHTLYQLVQAAHLFFEHAMEEKEIQIYGGSAILDLQGLGMKHIRQITPKELRKVFFFVRSHLPVRGVGAHIINYPRFVYPIYYIIMKMLSKKLRQRVMLHSNLESLHERIDPTILPTCLGGTQELEDVKDVSLLGRFFELNRPSSEYQQIGM